VSGKEKQHSLDKVEDGDPVADGGEEMGTVRTEEKVASTVHRSQKVGELTSRVSRGDTST